MNNELELNTKVKDSILLIGNSRKVTSPGFGRGNSKITVFSSSSGGSAGR